MAKRKSAKKGSAKKKKDAPGVSLEKLVARIQQMMDPKSTVSHNEVLKDRVGNKRQYDVVIRGQFGGRPVLGVIECRDHRRKQGPAAVEAFAKKAQNLRANLRIIVSRAGFTEQALILAKDESVGCLSLLPEDPEQAGFSIGDFWYGVIRKWTNVRLMVHFAAKSGPRADFDTSTMKWRGKAVANWFIRKLLTTHGGETKEGEQAFKLVLDEPRDIEIEGTEYPVTGITCGATRVNRKKRKWVSWSGDAFYDWQTGRFTIPAGGRVVGSAVETDLSSWPDYDGEIPQMEKGRAGGSVMVVIYDVQKWDHTKDDEVPDLDSL